VCEYNPCITQLNGSACADISPNNKCRIPAADPVTKCIPDRCGNFSSSVELCGMVPECVWSWSDGSCGYNPCVNSVRITPGSGNECTGPSEGNDACVVGENIVCLPQKCVGLSKDVCVMATECLYDDVNSECVYNPCISKKNLSVCEGNCDAAFKGHHQNKTHDICIPNDWCDKYSPPRSDCEDRYECMIEGPNCVYNPCVTEYNKVGSETPDVCVGDCELYHGYCHPATCSNHDGAGNAAVCNAEPLCQYNYSGGTCVQNRCSGKVGECRVNGDETKCVMDLCSLGDGSKAGCVGDCMYLESSSTCVFNGCPPTGCRACAFDSVCSDVCLKDADAKCVPNRCIGIFVSVCESLMMKNAFFLSHKFV
jgi:hypothetical protein